MLQPRLSDPDPTRLPGPVPTVCDPRRAIPARFAPESPRIRRVHGARPGRGVRAALLAASLFSARAAADDRDNCLYCHQFPGLSRLDSASGRVRLYYVDPSYVHELSGPHARLACTDCHEPSEVAVIPHEPAGRVDCTRQCHLVDSSGNERRFSHAPIAAMLERSAHTPEVLSSVELSTGPILEPGQSLCLSCHDEPKFRDPGGFLPAMRALEGRVFDRCDTCHGTQLQVDVHYYLKHVAARLAPARPTLEIAQVCGVCHSDPKFVETHQLHDAVASFVRSFHGKAALLGDNSTANCISCHAGAGENAHLMLPPSNPLSSVSPARAPDSCRSTACHPGADKSIAQTAVHLNLQKEQALLEYVLVAAFILLTLFSFGPSMVIVVLELVHIVIGVTHRHEEYYERLTDAVMAHPQGRQRLKRFTVSQRLQHWVLVILFVLLVLTGFPMKFVDRDWARTLVDWFGGLGTARIIHHWAGICLCAGFAVHMLYVLRTMRKRMKTARREGQPMSWFTAILTLPLWVSPEDGRKALQLFKYLLLLRRDPPTFGRFSFKEKLEYIGVFWGTTLLGITGLMLWGEQLATHLFSGRILNLALIAHTYEAFLAVIHVGILHIFNVIFAPGVFPLSPAMFTGQTPKAEMAEAHGEQVAAAAAELGVRVEGAHHE